MKTKNQKNLLLSLIKDDLINYKLVSALNALGLHATDYFLHLSDIIFDLAGFKNDAYSDEVYELYLQKIKTVQGIAINTSTKQLDALALDIYLLLDGKRPKAARLNVVKQHAKPQVRRLVVAA